MTRMEFARMVLAAVESGRIPIHHHDRIIEFYDRCVRAHQAGGDDRAVAALVAQVKSLGVPEPESARAEPQIKIREYRHPGLGNPSPRKNR